MSNEAITEGILFIVGDEGISFGSLKEFLEINEEDLNKIINSLKEKYNSENSGINLEVLGDKYKLTTKKEHAEFYKKYFDCSKESSMTQSTLETLAIIAYNQPITRLKIDEIRGVCSSYVLRKLSLMGFVCESGRSDLPGRPIEYSVTDKFLDYFGLSSIEELPNMEEFNLEHLVQDEDLFNTN